MEGNPNARKRLTMWQAAKFALGLVVGVVAGFATCSALAQRLFDATKSPVETALSYRIETIPIEAICASIASGRQILGDDRVTAWSDGNSYLVLGWQVENLKPVVYWTGAGVQPDQPECKKKP